MNKPGLFVIAVCLAGVCCAGLLPQFPQPKDSPAKMRTIYLSLTNGIYAQANGDFEDVHLIHIKRYIFTGKDTNPFGSEPTNVIAEKDIVLGSTIIPRPRQIKTNLTLEQWRSLQPPIPPIDQ